MRTDEHPPHDVAMEFIASGDDEPTRRFVEPTLQCRTDTDGLFRARRGRPNSDSYDTPVGAMPALVRMTAPGELLMRPAGTPIRCRKTATCVGGKGPASDELRRQRDTILRARTTPEAPRMEHLATGMRRVLLAERERDKGHLFGMLMMFAVGLGVILTLMLRS